MPTYAYLFREKYVVAPGSSEAPLTGECHPIPKPKVTPLVSHNLLCTTLRLSYTYKYKYKYTYLMSPYLYFCDVLQSSTLTPKVN